MTLLTEGKCSDLIKLSYASPGTEAGAGVIKPEHRQNTPCIYQNKKWERQMNVVLHTLKKKKLGIVTRTCFAVGGIPSGFLIALTSTFVLVFYSNALHLPASLIALILGVTLVVDAIMDPFIGYLSDNFNSRFGRRHGFMYLAILPTALFNYAIWAPPLNLEGLSLALYLLIMLIGMRISLSLFEVPSSALLPEMTEDYDDRSHLASSRIALAWIVVPAFSVAVYGYWLSSTPAFPDGLSNPEGYRQIGFWSSLIVAVSMIICSVGLHPMIPRLAKPSPGGRTGVAAIFERWRSSFAEPTIAPLLFASAATATGFTVYAALFSYQFGYFWKLNSDQMAGTQLLWLLDGALVLLSPLIITRVGDKKSIALWSLIAICLSVTLPVALYFSGLMTANSSVPEFAVLSIFLFVDTGAFIIIMGMIGAMLADATEQLEVKTERRQEGTIYGAQSLVTKTSSAIGIAVAGLLLDAINFPQEHLEGIQPQVIEHLGIAWVGGGVIFYILALSALCYYRVTRHSHAATIELLRQRRIMEKTLNLEKSKLP